MLLSQIHRTAVEMKNNFHKEEKHARKIGNSNKKEREEQCKCNWKISYAYHCRVCTGSETSSPRSGWPGTCTNVSVVGTCPEAFAAKQLCHCWCPGSAGGKQRRRNPPVWYRPRGSAISVAENVNLLREAPRTECHGTLLRDPSACCSNPIWQMHDDVLKRESKGRKRKGKGTEVFIVIVTTCVVISTWLASRWTLIREIRAKHSRVFLSFASKFFIDYRWLLCNSSKFLFLYVSLYN